MTKMEKSFNKVPNIARFYSKNKLYFALAFFIILMILPYTVVKSSYALGVVTKILMYAIAASGLNLINGYSGQTNLGMAGFLAIGSYTASVLWWKFNVPTAVGFLAGILLSGLVGYILSLPTLRLQGTYLTIITLGFSEVIRMIIVNWQDVTNGSIGIMGIDGLSIFGFQLPAGSKTYYLFTLLCLIIVIFCLSRLLNSRVGRAWISIREGQDAARSLGVEVSKYKSLNFVIGAMIGGLAGCVMTFYYRQASPDMYTLDEGFNILAMVTVGGTGTLVGPIVGAVFVFTLTELLRFASRFRLVIYAMLIILTMWIRPQGIAGARDSTIAHYAAIKFPKLKRGGADDGDANLGS